MIEGSQTDSGGSKSAFCQLGEEAAMRCTSGRKDWLLSGRGEVLADDYLTGFGAFDVQHVDAGGWSLQEVGS